MASAIGASVGAMGAAIAVGLIQSTASLFIVWRFWFASCLLGIVTVAPLLVGIGEVVRQLPPRRELVDGVAGILMLAALCAFVISLPQRPWSTAVPVMLVFPVLTMGYCTLPARVRCHSGIRCCFSHRLVDNLQRWAFWRC